MNSETNMCANAAMQRFLDQYNRAVSTNRSDDWTKAASLAKQWHAALAAAPDHVPSDAQILAFTDWIMEGNWRTGEVSNELVLEKARDLMGATTPPVQINIPRMQKALAGPSLPVPEGITFEGFRESMAQHALLHAQGSDGFTIERDVPDYFTVRHIDRFESTFSSMPPVTRQGLAWICELAKKALEPTDAAVDAGIAAFKEST